MASVSSAIICFFFITEMKSLLGYKNQQAQCLRNLHQEGEILQKEAIIY